MKLHWLSLLLPLILLVPTACGRSKLSSRQTEQDAAKQPAFRPFTITTADLPLLDYKPFRTDKKITNEDIEWMVLFGKTDEAPIRPSSTVTFTPEEQWSFHALPTGKDSDSYFILRCKKQESETKYYFAYTTKEGISLREISREVHLPPPNGMTEHRLFRISLSSEGEYYVDISQTRTTSDSFERTNIWADPFLVRRDYYSTERGPADIRAEYPDSVAPVIFSSEDLESSDYITLDSLWNQFRMSEYYNDLPDVMFHVLPPCYKNHDLVVERTKTAAGDRYLLRRLNLKWDGQEQRNRIAFQGINPDNKPLLDLTPKRLDPLTGETVTTQFQIFAGNFVEIYEKRMRDSLIQQNIYSFFPYYQEPPDDDLLDDQIHYQLIQGVDSVLCDRSRCDDLPEAVATKNYMQWLARNNELQNLDLINTDGIYRVDTVACNRLLELLRGSDLVSEKYLHDWQDYFAEAQKYYADNQIDDGPPEYFDYDLFLYSQEDANLSWNVILRGKTLVTRVCQITRDRSVVNVDVGYGNELTFALSLHNNQWKIDGLSDYGAYYPAEEPLVIFMAQYDNQRERMLKHYDIIQRAQMDGQTDDQSITEVIPTFRRYGIRVDVFDPEYYDEVRFPNDSIVYLSDFYCSDALLYLPGKAPVLIPNFDSTHDWNAIDNYFNLTSH